MEGNNVNGLKGSVKYALMSVLLEKIEHAGITDGTYPELEELTPGVLTFSLLKSNVDMEELLRVKESLGAVKMRIANGNKYSFKIVIEGEKELFLRFLSQSRTFAPTPPFRKV